MKAHWNMRSPFNTLSLTLLMLCCLALLIPRPADAQEKRSDIDENGRVAGTMPGPATARPATQPTDPTGTDCDQDGGKCALAPQGTTVSQPGSSAVNDGDEARTLTGMLSFQIQDGAPTNSVHIADDGNVGIGTKAPLGRLHVVAQPGVEGTSDILLLDGNGNLEIGGLLTEASSVLLKERFVAIDGQDVLDRLATIPITTWNYKTDAPSIRHMGPMAQDFYTAFGLGKDDQHIAPLDANGVALAGVQTLYQHVQVQAAHIATLERQNADLLQRLEALEALVQQRNE